MWVNNMTLSNEILYQWRGTPDNHCKEVDSIIKMGYSAWTIVKGDQFGVAIPNEKGASIDESFAGADLFSGMLTVQGNELSTLILMSENRSSMEPFSYLCSEFIQVGNSGQRRSEITDNPLAWWQQWKELLGNKNVDEMVYDTLGELVVLYYLSTHGDVAEWNGPTGATYDIDCGNKFVEVKSTKSRNKREITLNNEFQLQPPPGSNLQIALCQFEDAISGISINRIVGLLTNIGYDRNDLNGKLRKKGFRENKSARNRNYILHGITFYVVDDAFPAIRNESFVGGAKPVGVKSYTYTVTLDGIHGTEVQFQKDDKINEVQNN